MQTRTLLFIVCLAALQFACRPYSKSSSDEVSGINVRKATPDISLSKLMDSLQYDKTETRIYIDKSDLTLGIYVDQQLIKLYPIVLGKNQVDDKRREGDNCTPEGKFIIRDLYPHKSWSKFIWVNYPTEESYAKHNAAKAAGTVKQSAGIGGEIGIHGVPDGTDYMIDEKMHWTAGCISLKNVHVNEIFEYVQVGTSIEIVQ